MAVTNDDVKQQAVRIGTATRANLLHIIISQLACVPLYGYVCVMCEEEKEIVIALRKS